MSIKRWKGTTSGVWDTLGTTFANANWMNAAGDALAAAIPQGSQIINITDMSWGSQGAGVTVTITVASGPQLVAGDSIILTGAVHGNGIQTIVTSNTTTYTFVADTTSWGVYAGPYALGTMYYAGDDVQMLKGDKLAPSAPSISAATKASQCVLTVGSHTIVAGNFVLISSVGGMTQLNGNVYSVVSVDATHLTLNVNSTSFTTYTSGGTATLQTFYCTTGPSTATTIHDLTITLASNQNPVGIIGSNGVNLSISGNFTITEDACSLGFSSTNIIFGGASSRPILLSSGTAVFRLQPNDTTSTNSPRYTYLDVSSGATATLIALDYVDQTKKGGSVHLSSGSSTNRTMAGTLNIGNPLNPSEGSGGYSNIIFLAAGDTGGVYNFYHSANSNFSTSFIQLASTINVYASMIFSVQSSLFIEDLVFNIHAATLLYVPGPLTTGQHVVSNFTINAYAPVTISNLNIANNKTITINALVDTEVNLINNFGNIVVNGVCTINGVKNTVAPSHLVESGVPRWTSATGDDVGTYPANVSIVNATSKQEIKI